MYSESDLEASPKHLDSAISPETQPQRGRPSANSRQGWRWFLGNPARRAILKRLVLGPCNPANLAHGLSMKYDRAFWHLQLLAEGGLVAAEEGDRTTRESGNYRYYHLTEDGRKALMEAGELQVNVSGR